jgi:tryptophan synthase beta chain
MIDRGYYGELGGAYIPEILFSTFEELNAAFQKAKNDPAFWQEYLNMMSTYSCRPTPLTFAENLARHFDGPRMYIKR